MKLPLWYIYVNLWTRNLTKNDENLSIESIIYEKLPAQNGHKYLYSPNDVKLWISDAIKLL